MKLPQEASQDPGTRMGMLRAFAKTWRKELELPTDLEVKGTLEAHQLFLLTEIKWLASYCLQSCNSYAAVAEKFMIVEAKRAERALEFFRPYILPSGHLEYHPPNLTDKEPVAARRPVDSVMEAMVEVYDHLVLEDPAYGGWVSELQRSDPAIAGAALMSYKRKRGRPSGPSPKVAIRVITVSALIYVLNFSLPRALAVWSTWFDDAALDATDQFNEEWGKSLLYFWRAFVLRSSKFTEVDTATLEDHYRTWEEDMKRRGALALPTKTPEFPPLGWTGLSSTLATEPEPR
jgi:hypothetical protein